MITVTEKDTTEPRAFLGGTCGTSTWRDQLIPMLHVDYFNPVVPDWTEECYQKELHEREVDTVIVYAITNEMEGVYSIAEVVDDSNKRPKRVVFCNLYQPTSEKDFIYKSLTKVEKMVENNGAQVVRSIEELASVINKRVSDRVQSLNSSSAQGSTLGASLDPTFSSISFNS